MTILEEAPLSWAGSASAPLASGEFRVPLLDGCAEGIYRRRGRWAVTRGAVHAPAGGADLALSEYLEVLRQRWLRPLFLALPDPSPYARRGLYTRPCGAEAVLHLPGYDIATAERELPRDVAAANRAGLMVLPYRPAHAAEVAQLAPAAVLTRPGAEAWVAVDPAGAVQGVTVWDTAPDLSRGDRRDRSDTDAVRVLQLVAAHSRAPQSVIELLVADAVEEYRYRGLQALRLGWRSASRWWSVPGAAAFGVPPAVLERFRPRWATRWLAIPSGLQLPAAAWALR